MIEYNYFNFGAIREIQDGTYTDGENDLLQECVMWNHSLSEVINRIKHLSNNIPMVYSIIATK